MKIPFIKKSAGKFGGRPYIEGTRITVDDVVSSYSLILDALVIREMRADWFPDLSEEQIRAALDYYRQSPSEVKDRLQQDRLVRLTDEYSAAG